MNIQVSFNVGTSIREACIEAKEFAVKMNLEWVEFQFNEIACSISQTCSVEKACNMYFKACEKDSKYKFVIS